MSELKLPGTSQTAIKQVKGGKLELVFSKGATVRPDRWEFRDRDDLIGHLGKLFGGKRDNVGLNGSVKRKGKYQRTNAKGDLVFTFGDPILDLITAATPHRPGESADERVRRGKRALGRSSRISSVTLRVLCVLA